MSEIIFSHGGTLDKYIGDGLMAIFGAPTASSEDAKNALKAAVTMQLQLITLNKELEAEGFQRIQIGDVTMAVNRPAASFVCQRSGRIRLDVKECDFCPLPIEGPHYIGANARRPAGDQNHTVFQTGVGGEHA